MLRTDIHEILATKRAEFWEGGGILGLAYLPIAQALDESGADIDLYGGTSAGAFTAMVRACGGGHGYLRRLMRTTRWERFQGPGWPRELWTTQIWRLIRRGGLNKLSYPRRFLTNALRDLGFPEDLTFRQLHERTGRHLVVAVTSEDDEEPRLLGYDPPPGTNHHPKTMGFEIRDAVLASMAIPFFYVPVEIENRPYSDGGATWNHPIDAAVYPWPGRPDGYSPDEVIGARLDSSAEISGQISYQPGFVARIKRMIRLLRRQANKTHIPDEYWPSIIRIDTGNHRATSFRIGASAKRELVAAGQAALEEWIDKKKQAREHDDAI